MPFQAVLVGLYECKLPCCKGVECGAVVLLIAIDKVSVPAVPGGVLYIPGRHVDAAGKCYRYVRRARVCPPGIAFIQRQSPVNVVPCRRKEPSAEGTIWSGCPYTHPADGKTVEANHRYTVAGFPLQRSRTDDVPVVGFGSLSVMSVESK